MVKRKWTGNLHVCFVQCPITKCVWGTVGACFGTRRVPENVVQYKQWINDSLPNGKHVHHFGFASVCWAVWKCRNKVVFDKKKIKSPAEIILHACIFMLY